MKKANFEKIINRITTLTVCLSTVAFVLTITAGPIFLYRRFDMLTTAILSIILLPVIGALIFMFIGFIGHLAEKILEKIML